MKRFIPDLRVITVAIGDIKPYDNNPWEHPPEQVKLIGRSITKHGFVAPILVNKDMVVIAGHGRLLAARELGMSHVPVIILPHLTEVEERSLRIADNKISHQGRWSVENLRAEFELIVEHDVSFDPVDIGFQTAEFDAVRFGNKEECEPDLVPEPDPDAPLVSRPDDLWTSTDGRYSILYGDARNKASYERLLADERADLSFTDIPFNVPVNGHVSGLGKTRHAEFAMASGEMSDEDFAAFTETVLTHQRDYSKPGSVSMQFIDWRSVEMMIGVGKRVYGTMLNLCIWVKTNAGMGSLWRSQYEMVCVFRTPGGKHQNNVQLGKYGRNRSNVWTYAGVNSFRKDRMKDLQAHPTCKPVDLIADAILDVTNRNDLVLDAFLGSGTTLLAAHKTGRRAAGIEIDPRYVDLAITRFTEKTGIHFTNQDGQSFEEARAARIIGDV